MSKSSAPAVTACLVLFVAAAGTAGFAFVARSQAELARRREVAAVRAEAADYERRLAEEAARRSALEARLAGPDGGRSDRARKLESDLVAVTESLRAARDEAREMRRDLAERSAELADPSRTEERESLQRAIEQADARIAAAEEEFSAGVAEREAALARASTRVDELEKRVLDQEAALSELRARASAAPIARPNEDDLSRLRRIFGKAADVADGDKLVVALGADASWLDALEILAREPTYARSAWRHARRIPAFDLARVDAWIESGVRGDGVDLAVDALLERLSADDSSALSAALTRRLDAPSAATRQVALLAALKVEDREALTILAPRVVERLDDADATVAATAARGLEDPRLLLPAARALTTRLLRATHPRRAALLAALLQVQPRETAELAAAAALDDDDLVGELDRACDGDERLDVLVGLAAILDDPARAPRPLLRRLAASLGIDAESADSRAVRAALVNDSRFQPWLRSALTHPATRDDPEVVRRLRDAVGRAEPAGVIARLDVGAQDLGISARALTSIWARFADDDEPNLRRRARAALADSGDFRAAPRLDSALASEDDPTLRRQMMLSLFRLGHRTGEATLRAILGGSTEDRQKLLDDLAADGSEPALRLAETVLDLEDWTGAWRLIELYGQFGHKLPRARVEQVLEGPLIEPNRAAVYFQVLERALGDDTRALVGQMLIEGRCRERAECLRYAALPPDDRLLPIVLAQIDDEEPRARAAALQVLASYQPENHIDRVLPLVNDSDSRVRNQLANLLGAVVDPIARGALVVLSRDDDDFVRESAALALGHQDDDERVRGALEARLRDTAAEVQLAARISLCRMGHYEEMPVLMQALDDDWLGARARRFLTTRFGREFTTGAEWKDWWDREGRHAAEQGR